MSKQNCAPSATGGSKKSTYSPMLHTESPAGFNRDLISRALPKSPGFGGYAINEDAGEDVAVLSIDYDDRRFRNNGLGTGTGTGPSERIR